ncbi:MAG: helix-turn-helix domain-containing protein [Firmicutes bacterium]|nr:helix-turn-helix domain-containing protein [Bacillota bacterium]
MKDYQRAFIENLKAFMNDNNISQTVLASKVSVDQTTVSAWLRGESEPTLTKICLLMDFFNCSFEDLID